MKSKQKKRRVTAEEFVRIWQTAKTLSEVYDSLGITRQQTAWHRASQLRAIGVPLKKFFRSPARLNIPKLAGLAKSLNGEVTS